MEVEKVITSSTSNTIIKVKNHEGLKLVRLIFVLAMIIRLDSQILNIIKEKDTGSIIIKLLGVMVIRGFTIVGITNAQSKSIARLVVDHFILGRVKSEALNIIIFSIGLGWEQQ